MLFSRHRRGPRRVVVDIGSRSIKLAAVTSENQGPVISRATTVAIPPGSVRNGSIVNTTAVTEAIGAFARAERLQGAAAATAVPGRIVMIRFLELPIMDGKELDTTVEFEAMRLIPEALSNVYLDYQIISMNPARGVGKRTVLLTAARKQLVRSYIDVLAHAGLVPAIIDVDYFALHNLCAHLYPDTADQTVCLVHAGESVTTVTLSLNREPLFFSSELEIAGQLFTETLAGDLGISVEEAEAMKIRNDPERTPRDFTRSINTLCCTFAAELDCQLNRFAAMSGYRTIDRLFLCGGTSKLEGFQKTAHQLLRDRVCRFELLLGDSNGTDGALKKLPPDFAVVGGLALRWS